MVQTISGHNRCGVGARASRHSAEMMICARAATVGEAVAMQWRSWRRSAVAMEVLPVTWLRPYLRSGLGFVGGKCGSGEPRALSCRPPPLFITQGDGGPPAIDGLGAPDQGVSQGPRRPLGFL
jgi:hypothetical protein